MDRRGEIWFWWHYDIYSFAERIGIDVGICIKQAKRTCSWRLNDSVPLRVALGDVVKYVNIVSRIVFILRILSIGFSIKFGLIRGVIIAVIREGCARSNVWRGMSIIGNQANFGRS
jgi:hypothetical protein